MVCDDINDFERVELCTTNCKNVLCWKMYQLSLITASIRSQCTFDYVAVSSKTSHPPRPSGYTQGICLEVYFQCIILSGNKQTVVQQLSDTLDIVVVISRI